MSAFVKVEDMVDAVAQHLGRANIKYVQSHEGLTEGIHDFPTMQVYAESGDPEPESGTYTTTFRGGVKQEDLYLKAVVYTGKRSHLAANVTAEIRVIDSVREVFHEINTKHSDGNQQDGYFGRTEIQSWQYDWQRVTITHNQEQYFGVEFEIVLRIG